jgi:hypothetical protein
VRAIVLVLDFLISTFGIRASVLNSRFMGSTRREFEDEDEREGGATPEKYYLTTGRFIPTVR